MQTSLLPMHSLKSLKEDYNLKLKRGSQPASSFLFTKLFKIGEVRQKEAKATEKTMPPKSNINIIKNNNIVSPPTKSFHHNLLSLYREQLWH